MSQQSTCRRAGKLVRVLTHGHPESAAFYAAACLAALAVLWSNWVPEKPPLVVPTAIIAVLVFFVVRFLRCVTGKELKFQFSLRTLLLFIAVASACFSWIAFNLRRAETQRAAVAELRSRHATFWYDWKWEQFGEAPTDGDYVLISEYVPPVPLWLWNLFGEDFFASPVHVNFGKDTVDEDVAYLKDLPSLTWVDLAGSAHVTDSGVKHLKGLENLELLALGETGVSDAGLAYLKELKRLERLDFSWTTVSDEAMQALSESLPNTFIDNERV